MGSCCIMQGAQPELCDDLEGREVQGGGETCILMSDTRCYMAETNTTS